MNVSKINASKNCKIVLKFYPFYLDTIGCPRTKQFAE